MRVLWRSKSKLWISSRWAGRDREREREEVREMGRAMIMLKVWSLKRSLVVMWSKVGKPVTTSLRADYLGQGIDSHTLLVRIHSSTAQTGRFFYHGSKIGFLLLFTQQLFSWLGIVQLLLHVTCWGGIPVKL